MSLISLLLVSVEFVGRADVILDTDILKFEYLTQLLVDSSYIPLVLKFYQCQEIERVVNFKSDRLDLK